MQMERGFLLFILLNGLYLGIPLLGQKVDGPRIPNNEDIGGTFNPFSDVSIKPPVNRYSNYIDILNHKTPIALVTNNEVEKYIDYFLSHRRNDLTTYLSRTKLFFPLIEQMLDKYNLPLELKYIAVIESGLNPMANSKSGAVGLWQFLYNTCALLDLTVDSYIDERRDPYKSTEAACRYLRYLYNTYNDWNLVMASYNGGPGEVRKAIERSGGKTDYWELRPFLSKQASNYIPVFIAINYLMNYYKLHGLNIVAPDFAFEDIDTIQVNYSLTFNRITAVLGISVKDLERLNPMYKKKIVPDLDSACTLILPRELVYEYLKHEQEISGIYSEDRNYNTLVANAGDTQNRTKVLHIVKNGDFFHKIALSYNCTIENIKAWNNLSSLELYPGQILEIWIKPSTEICE